MHPSAAHVLHVSGQEGFKHILTIWCDPIRKLKILLHNGGFSPKSLSLVSISEGFMVLNTKL